MTDLSGTYLSPWYGDWYAAFYLSRHRDDDTQMCVICARAPWEARKLLDVLLRKDRDEQGRYQFVWDDDCTIRAPSGIVISTRWYPREMREAVEHEYSLKEMALDYPEPNRSWAKRFRDGPPQPRTIEEDRGHAARAERKAAKAAARGPTVDVPAGYVHAREVALAMGVDAKLVRRGLRAIMTKPAWGWNFDPKELDGLKKKIKEWLDA